MSYSYEAEKPTLFTDQGQRMFLAIRDYAFTLIEQAGAARLDKIISGARGGDSWTMLACVDRLVELGELREIGSESVTQHKVYTRASR